jgi:hypothetical protein
MASGTSKQEETPDSWSVSLISVEIAPLVLLLLSTGANNQERTRQQCNSRSSRSRIDLRGRYRLRQSEAGYSNQQQHRSKDFHLILQFIELVLVLPTGTNYQQRTRKQCQGATRGSWIDLGDENCAGKTGDSNKHQCHS